MPATDVEDVKAGLHIFTEELPAPHASRGARFRHGRISILNGRSMIRAPISQGTPAAAAQGEWSRDGILHQQSFLSISAACERRDPRGFFCFPGRHHLVCEIQPTHSPEGALFWRLFQRLSNLLTSDPSCSACTLLAMNEQCTCRQGCRRFVLTGPRFGMAPMISGIGISALVLADGDEKSRGW